MFLPHLIFIKKFIVLSLVCTLVYAVTLNTSNAQTYTSSPFDIKIYISNQDPQTKIFKAKVEINSRITSQRNTMKWILPEGLKSGNGDREIEGFYCQLDTGINTSCKHADTIKNNADIFDFEISLVPYSQVNGPIIFSLQSYIDSGEKNYTITQIANIETDKTFTLIPVSKTYTQNLNLINLKNLSVQITIGTTLLYIGLIIFKRIYLYVNPQIKSELPSDSQILQTYKHLARQGMIPPLSK